jgi:sugar phosphate permease
MVRAGSFIPQLLSSLPESGWRYSWFALAISVLVIAIVAFSFIRNNPSVKGLSQIGVTQGHPLPAPEHNSSKIGWGAIVRTSSVWHLAFIYVLFGFSYIIYMTFYVPYLGGEAGYTREEAGRFLALVGGFSIASGLLWGWISDKIGRKFALAIVFGLQSASFVIFGLFKTPGGILLSSILFALTAWSIPAIMAAATGDMLGPRLAPATLGFITFFFGIGQVAGPFTGGRIAQATGSFGIVFVIAGCAAFVGALASLTIRTHVQPVKQERF